MKKTGLVLALSACIALSACGNDNDKQDELANDVGAEDPTVTTWQAPEIRGPLEKTDQTDASAVGEAVTKQIFSWDAAHDRSSGSAARKAEPLMNEDFATGNRNSWEAMLKIPGKQWEGWVADEAVASVELTEGLEQRPPDTEMEAFRQYSVDVTMKGKQDETKIHYDVFVTLEHLGWWRVNDMQISQPQFPAAR
ncbi:TPA: hypothetical protein JAK05_002223 [Corynebacterium striatum]|nr:hypothetical protein [Corynebacterium striatum]HAT6564302.1 hypothetical protein [Corynebacterium striatum]HAT6569764.1 hypothetical protein [Corynebacterium striatum]